MDINNIQNTFNISYDKSLDTNNNLTNTLSPKVNLQNQQNNKTSPQNIQQQFKEVSKKEEVAETQRTYSEISTVKTNSASTTKSNPEEILRNLQQLLEKPETQTINTTKSNIVELLQDTQLNKLKEKNKEQKNILQNKLLGEQKTSSLRGLFLSTNLSLFKSWLKKIKQKPGSGEEVEATEDIDDSIFLENETGKNGISEKAIKIKNNSLVKQHQLFSLNMQASLRYLKNLKTFNHKYSPEMLIYDQDTGCVDAKETLECLGWDDIENFQTKLNTELNLNTLKEIHTNNKILNAANDSGINVYKATHPLHENKKVTLAIESLTGDITMMEHLTDLEKLELKDKIYKIYNVSS